MKILKAAVLVVMAPMVALAAEGITTNPTVAPAPAPAAAPSPGTPAGTRSATASWSLLTDEQKAQLQGLTVGVDLDHWLGTATFYKSTYDPSVDSKPVPNNAYLAANLSVTLRYAFMVRQTLLAVSLAGRLTYEYTLPDNSNGRRFSPWDTRLGLSAPSLYKNEFTGISVSPSIGLVIPTTIESWQATLITSLSVGLAVAKSAGRFDFLLTGSGSRGFHLNPMNAIQAQTVAEQTQTQAASGQLTVLSRAGETLSDSFGMNTAWIASVGGSIKFRATEELSFSIGYTYLHYWKYEIPNDQYTPQALDSNGNPVAKPNGQVDRTFGVVSADYALNDHFGVSLSASTIQFPRSLGAGGLAGSYRFPFWAVDNGPSNATSVNFTFSASY